MDNENKLIRKKKYIGICVNDKADKTIKVKIERVKTHSLYKKKMRRSKNYIVHDEKNIAHIGDRVEIIESRPLSSTKRWRLVRIVEKAK